MYPRTSLEREQANSQTRLQFIALLRELQDLTIANRLPQFFLVSCCESLSKVVVAIRQFAAAYGKPPGSSMIP